MSTGHHPYHADRTIAAIATPPGEGGVAIVRISGEKALAIGQKVFNKPIHTFKSHTAHYGSVVDRNLEKIDDVLLLVMYGPRSYTGENTVEIHCHGGSLITRRVFEAILEAGAAPAQPGEFTFKAYMNGKIDLAQAEAIGELIGAKNDYAIAAANSQLAGTLSKKIAHFQKEITYIAAMIEAWVDFPEEELEFASADSVCSKLEQLQEEMQKLIKTFHEGKIIHEGLCLCLVGAPNVGKSSLMNALLDSEKAIVSALPGTTRDLVEGDLRLNGLNVKLIDTAGIREETADPIEMEGMRRTHSAIESADLILFVLDGEELDRGATSYSSKIAQALLDKNVDKKSVVIINKIDLLSGEKSSSLVAEEKRRRYTGSPILGVSAKTKQGIEELHIAIDKVIWEGKPPSKEEIILTNLRHKNSLQAAAEALGYVIQGLKKGVSPELLASDIRYSLTMLGLVIGTDITDDILSTIFSTFCIGK